MSNKYWIRIIKQDGTVEDIEQEGIDAKIVYRSFDEFDDQCSVCMEKKKDCESIYGEQHKDSQ